MYRLLIPLLALYHFFAPHPPYAQMVDRVSASVVRITGIKDIDEGPFGVIHAHYVCSGEVIAPGKVLTAAHCLGSPMWADGQPILAVIQADTRTDLALILVHTDKPFLTVRDAPVVRFESLTGIGYGFGWSRLLVIHAHVILADYSPEPEMAPGIFVQPSYVGGMSGGPVVDANGQLVGIVQRGAEGIGYGVGTLIIRAFLLGVNS